MTEAGGIMATSIGQIGLDLVVNKNQFESQMQGITGLAKKAGAALTAAFGIKSWSVLENSVWNLDLTWQKFRTS